MPKKLDPVAVQGDLPLYLEINLDTPATGCGTRPFIVVEVDGRYARLLNIAQMSTVRVHLTELGRHRALDVKPRELARRLRAKRRERMALGLAAGRHNIYRRALEACKLGAPLGRDHVAEADTKKPVMKKVPSTARGVVRLLAEGNPKKPGSRAHRDFAKYRDGMTVAEYLAAAEGDGKFLLRYDAAHGYIRVE